MNTNTASSRVRLGGALVLMSACAKNAHHTGTVGDKGEVEFNYQGPGCFFGCPLEQPLLVGTHTTISVSDAGDVHGLQVKASKPGVADFAVERACKCVRKDGNGGELMIAENGSCTGVWTKHCDNTLLVQAKAQGKTLLELRDAHGALIDEVEVIAHEAASAVIDATYMSRLGKAEVSDLMLGPSESVQLEASLYDADGLELLAPEGVHWAVDDDSIAIVTAFLKSGKELDDGTSVGVQAKSEGTTSLTMTVPGLQRTLDIAVASP
jgi:hypothetical protein